MVGETLEQHCEMSSIDCVGFQNAYFEKDNDASGGTKLILRKPIQNNEIISIMFEIK